jgi:hypothetical protein
MREAGSNAGKTLVLIKPVLLEYRNPQFPQLPYFLVVFNLNP